MLKKMYDLQKKKGKKGFSMIELIIVIAIMAILIALIGAQLIPFLEKSRERKDQATLDTVLTNFKAAVGETEYNETGKSFTGIASLPTEVQDEYKNFAGTAYDTDAEITAAFKSKEAKGGTVILGIDDDGVLYVQVTGTNSNPNHGGLYASEKYTGYVKDKDKKPSSSSSSSNGGSNS